MKGIVRPARRPNVPERSCFSDCRWKPYFQCHPHIIASRTSDSSSAELYVKGKSPDPETLANTLEKLAGEKVHLLFFFFLQGISLYSSSSPTRKSRQENTSPHKRDSNVRIQSCYRFI
jgi:hypothetical protein